MDTSLNCIAYQRVYSVMRDWNLFNLKSLTMMSSIVIKFNNAYGERYVTAEMKINAFVRG